SGRRAGTHRFAGTPRRGGVVAAAAGGDGRAGALAVARGAPGRLVACHSVSAGWGCRGGRRPLHPHLGRLGGARVPSGCPLRASRAKSAWVTTSTAGPKTAAPCRRQQTPGRRRNQVNRRLKTPKAA